MASWVPTLCQFNTIIFSVIELFSDWFHCISGLFSLPSGHVNNSNIYLLFHSPLPRIMYKESAFPNACCCPSEMFFTSPIFYFVQEQIVLYKIKSFFSPRLNFLQIVSNHSSLVSCYSQFQNSSKKETHQMYSSFFLHKENLKDKQVKKTPTLSNNLQENPALKVSFESF